MHMELLCDYGRLSFVVDVRSEYPSVVRAVFHVFGEYFLEDGVRKGEIFELLAHFAEVEDAEAQAFFIGIDNLFLLLIGNGEALFEVKDDYCGPIATAFHA